jgi:hypothetical protein
LPIPSPDLPCFLAGLLDEVVKASRLKGESEFLLLLVDAWTAKVLGSAVSFTELMDAGILGTV